MKIEIKPNIGSYTEEEATIRIAAFCRSQINRMRLDKKVVPIPELDKSPKDAEKFVNEFFQAYVADALKQGAVIYNSVQGRLAGQKEFEEKLK